MQCVYKISEKFFFFFNGKEKNFMTVWDFSNKAYPRKPYLLFSTSPGSINHQLTRCFRKILSQNIFLTQKKHSIAHKTPFASSEHTSFSPSI